MSEEPATPTLASSSSNQSNLSTSSTSNSLSANNISRAFNSSNHQRTTSNGASNPHAPPLVGMTGGAFDSNGSDEKSALAALLQGMQSLQLEVSIQQIKAACLLACLVAGISRDRERRGGERGSAESQESVRLL